MFLFHVLISADGIPSNQVKYLCDEVYVWKQFKVEAENKEEALRLLNGKWWELQYRTARAKLMLQHRKDLLSRSMPADSHQRPGIVTSLHHQRYKEVYRGRLFEEGDQLLNVMCHCLTQQQSGNDATSLSTCVT